MHDAIHTAKLDQTNGTTVADARNQLTVTHVRIHSGLRIDKPNLQQISRTVEKTLFAQIITACGQRQNGIGHLAKPRMMIVKTSGIDFPVAPDKRAVGVFRVGPPVRTLAKIIVRIAADGMPLAECHRPWAFFQALFAPLCQAESNFFPNAPPGLNLHTQFMRLLFIDQYKVHDNSSSLPPDFRGGIFIV